SAWDRSRKLSPGHSTPFATYELLRCAAPTRGFSARPADLFLREMVGPISVRARRRAVRCYRFADGHPAEDARCRARYLFRRPAAVAGATRLVLAASRARTSRGARLEDPRFVLRPHSKRASKCQPLRRSA